MSGSMDLGFRGAWSGHGKSVVGWSLGTCCDSAGRVLEGLEFPGVISPSLLDCSLEICVVIGGLFTCGFFNGVNSAGFKSCSSLASGARSLPHFDPRPSHLVLT